MKPKKGFTLIELLVVISIIALLLSILMPSLKRIKQQARDVICRSNLRQWGLTLQMYGSDYNNSLTPGWSAGKMWMTHLRPYYGGSGDIRLCPTATKFLSDIGVENYGTFSAWGVWGDADFYGGVVQPWAEAGDYGSYGINDWVHNPPKEGLLYQITEEQHRLYWRKLHVKGADNIPAFADCMWDGTGPGNSYPPPEFPGDNTTRWGSFCLPRHNEAVNMTFLDLSVQHVGLKRLWRLKWHREFYTDMRVDWPVWMEDFKDYD